MVMGRQWSVVYDANLAASSGNREIVSVEILLQIRIIVSYCSTHHDLLFCALVGVYVNVVFAGH